MGFVAGGQVKTFELLWGTTWRGGAFGLVAGTMGGTAYGALFANALIFAGLISQPQFDFKPSDVVSVIFAVLFFGLIGAVMGALFGVPTGLVVGIANGLLLGGLTRVFFFPLKNAQTYRRVVAVVSAVFTAMVAWICFIGIMLFYANRNAANVPVLAVIAAIPALIAGIGAGLISQSIARWYSDLQTPTSNHKGVIQNA